MSRYAFAFSRHQDYEPPAFGTRIEVIATTEDEGITKVLELSPESPPRGGEWRITLQSVREVGA